ncbi:MAG: preprotein translocase subunit SecY, partial [Nitriliruptoraceae bacterium]
MLKAFLNALKIPDLRGKLVFTLLLIVLYRVGSWLPVPFVDVQALEGVRSTNGGGSGIVSVINL